MTDDEGAVPRAAQRLAEVEALSGIGSWEWEIASDTLYCRAVTFAPPSSGSEFCTVQVIEHLN